MFGMVLALMGATEAHSEEQVAEPHGNPRATQSPHREELTNPRWYFLEKPELADFVHPTGDPVCAVVPVTVMGEILNAERRWGGQVAWEVDLRVEEDVPSLSVSNPQLIKVGFYQKIEDGAERYHLDKASPGDVYTGGAFLPLGKRVFVGLCGVGGHYMLIYVRKKPD